MFGIFNLTREETASRGKAKARENESEPCFGGFSSRFDYEECKKPRSKNPAAIAVCVLFCVFFGVTGIAAGIAISDFVQNNKPLYYPGASDPELPGVVNVDCGATSVCSAYDDAISLETVTVEQSVRYRIPRGVMVRIIDNTADSVFKTGDIIVAVNGSEITDADQIVSLSLTDGFTMRIFRQNKYIDISVSDSRD